MFENSKSYTHCPVAESVPSLVVTAPFTTHRVFDESSFLYFGEATGRRERRNRTERESYLHRFIYGEKEVMRGEILGSNGRQQARKVKNRIKIPNDAHRRPARPRADNTPGRRDASGQWRPAGIIPDWDRGLTPGRTRRSDLTAQPVR